MIEVTPSAQEYFAKLIAQQDVGELGLYLSVSNPGTPRAECELNFCQPNEVGPDDSKVSLQGFDLFVQAASDPFLVEAEMDFKATETGGELVVRAPNIKGHAPADHAPVEERVQWVLDSEVNPMVAAHGGQVSLVQITERMEVVLQFGGGCHGCGMVGVTLKEGVEKTMLERVPEITSVIDSTDHSTGANPYFSP